MEFEVNINKRRFKRKPDNLHTAGIQKNFVRETMDVSKLRHFLITGCTVKPAILKENGYFESQQVFFVDVDDGSSVKANIKKCNNTNGNAINNNLSVLDLIKQFQII